MHAIAGLLLIYCISCGHGRDQLPFNPTTDENNIKFIDDGGITEDTYPAINQGANEQNNYLVDMTEDTGNMASDQAFTFRSDPLIDQEADGIMEDADIDQPVDGEVFDSTDFADPDDVTGDPDNGVVDQAFTPGFDPLIDRQHDEIIEQQANGEVLDSTDFADPVDACNGIQSRLLQKLPTNGVCNVVKIMEKATGTACSSGHVYGFGRTLVIWSKKSGVSASICDIVTMFTGVSMATSCEAIQKKLVEPLIKGQLQLAAIQDILEAILLDKIKSFSRGYESFSKFFTETDLCPIDKGNPLDKINDLEKFFLSIDNVIKEAKHISTQIKKTLKNCRTWTVIKSLNVGISELGAELGLYVTSNSLDLVEVGMVRGYSASKSVVDPVPSVSISAGITITVVMGDRTVWGEWGYSFDFGATIPVYGVGVGGTVSLVFTADSNTQQLGNFIGFAFSVSVSVGAEESTTVDVDAGITCGYLGASNIAETQKKKCPGRSLKGEIESYKKKLTSIEQMRRSMVDRVKTCAELLLDKTKRCVTNLPKELLKSIKNNLDNVKKLVDVKAAFSRCKSTANTCVNGVAKCLKWKFNCKRVRRVREKTTCRSRYCRRVRQRASCRKRTCRKVCNKICGWICGWACKKLCDGSCIAWNFITKTICDGACKVWNWTTRTIVDRVYQIGSCAASGLVQLGKRCVKHLPTCAKLRGCYISPQTVHVPCQGGMMVPGGFTKLLG